MRKYFTEEQLDALRIEYQNYALLATVFLFRQREMMVQMNNPALLQLWSANIKHLSKLAGRILDDREQSLSEQT